MSQHQTSGSNHIARILSEVGRRIKARRLLPLLIFTLAIGIAALGGAILYSGPEWPMFAWPIAGATAVGWVLASLFVLSRSTRTSVVARRVDYSLHLSEQLSSSIDALRNGRDSSVVRSLVRRAGEAASGIDIRQAVPLRTPLLGISLAALLVASSGTAIAYGLLGSAPPEETASTHLAQETPSDTIAPEDLDVLAELIGDDAKRRDSEYLEALANSIKSLAEQAREGATQNDLETRLRALMEHAVSGYAGDNPEWLDGGDNANAALQNAVAFSTAQKEAAQQRAPMARMEGQGAKISSSDMYTLNDDRMARSATPPPQGNSPPSENAIADREGALINEDPGGRDTVARPMEHEAFTSAGSLPVGAASQSGKGESNIAGGGSQALAASSAFLETMADPTETMSIGADEVNEGSRIRMQVPTSAELSQTEAISGEKAFWDRQLAQVVTRHGIRQDASGVVSHYFNRPIAEPER